MRKPKLRRKTKWLIIGLGILLTAIYQSDRIMVRAVDQLNTWTDNSFKLSNKRNNLFHVFQNLNPKVLFPSDPPGIDTISITYEKETEIYVNNVIKRALNSSNIYEPGPFITNHDNKFCDSNKCSITFKNQEYTGNIKLQGQWKANFIYEKKSYALKLNGSSSSLPFKKLALITLEDHALPNLFANYLSNKYLKFNTHTKIIRLFINGENKGLYFSEHKDSKQLLNENGFKSAVIIKSIDEWNSQYQRSPHFNPFTYHPGNIRLKNFGKIINTAQVLDKYIANMNNPHFDSISQTYDLDYLAKFEALRFLTMDYHDIEGDNFKTIYDNNQKRFYPYFRMEQYFEPLSYNSEARIFDQSLNSKFENGSKLSENKLLMMLNRSDAFRLKRNQYLFEIWLQREQLMSTYDSLSNIYLDAICYDKTNRLPHRIMRTYLHDNRKVLIDNLDKVGKYLHYGRVFYALKQSKTMLELNVSPDINAAMGMKLELLGLGQNDIIELDFDNKVHHIEYGSLDSLLMQYKMTLNLNENLEVMASHYKVTLKSSKAFGLRKIEFYNSTTSNPIGKKDIYHYHSQLH